MNKQQVKGMAVRLTHVREWEYDHDTDKPIEESPMQKNNACTPMTLSGILVVAACLSASLGLASCQKEGGAEEAGRQIDQAAERMGNQLETTKASMDEKAERAGNYMEDAGITAKIKAEILAESTLKVFQIDVTTTDGVVTLSGTVDSPLSLERASEVARNNQGVKSVENNLVVK